MGPRPKSGGGGMWWQGRGWAQLQREVWEVAQGTVPGRGLIGLS